MTWQAISSGPYPPDIIKTRLQVLSGAEGGARHTFASTAKDLYKEHGAWGFLRGARPRMMSVSIWGRGLHSFPFPLKLSLLFPFPLNSSLLCPPYDPAEAMGVS
jgi:hypothetical protein